MMTTATLLSWTGTASRAQTTRGRQARAAAVVAAVAAVAIGLAACGTNHNSGVKASATAAAQATSTTAVQPTVGLANNAKFGDILVDGAGLTLYRDTSESGGRIACTGGCASAWPPLLLAAGAGTPTKAAGVTGTLGTVTRPDGGTQVTYNGMPLYRFKSDLHPGDVTGQGVGGFTVVPATGTPAPAATVAPTTGPPATAPPTTRTPVTTTPQRTSPPTTHPPATSPPATSPPATTPPQTSPPTTQPSPVTTAYCAYPPCY